MDYKDYSIQEYKNNFIKFYDESEKKKNDDKRREAQKRSILETSLSAMNKYPNVEPKDIWKVIYIAHVNNFSGINDPDVINLVISADNSWKKSSGHAFEEMIKELGNLYLKEHNIEILLQKDLNTLLKANEISNEVRDISWLKEQVKTSIFDLYISVIQDEKRYVYGCIQSKTSVRDRVTRDREPSMNAMNAFFVSIALVLDGEFLKLPKFNHMVNGGSQEFPTNGWHSVYVLTNENIADDRIKIINLDMETFTNDMVKGSKSWLTQRQWINSDWKP
ncbi:hypothetical protein BCT63_07675 [Vibrio kanaloae]|uniref:BsaWI family type II restriction enzyme n=1 Tax=Vibrio TaxID=662 RepID=UPI000C8292E3|nr:BsaWI family type II restriction enzyme [Vibrio kanaloae]PMM06054.1 hypothetical protein BCT63_07675 [Vibrio kanaloae]